MIPPRSAIRFLASVRSVQEALCVVAHGADIVDCKEPSSGALGALDVATIEEICRAVPEDIPVSATLGDDAVTATDLVQRVAACADAGVDFVKIGFDKDAPWQAALVQLAPHKPDRCRMVGVLLVDQGLDMTMIAALAKAGFSGVLLDTADKHSGPLPQLMPQQQLRSFVEQVQARSMFAGLAGALRAQHVASLATLKPDILGFRGALCHNHARRGEIDPDAVANIGKLIGSWNVNSNHNSVLEAGLQ